MPSQCLVATISGVAAFLAFGIATRAWFSAKGLPVKTLSITLLGSSNTPNGHAVFFGITNVGSQPRYVHLAQFNKKRRGNSSIFNPGEGVVEVVYAGRDYNPWQLSIHSIAEYSKTEQWRKRLARRIPIAVLACALEPELPKPVASEGPLMIRNKSLSTPKKL